MRHALNIGKEPKFNVIVVTSAVVHLLLITFIVVPLKTRDREYKSYFVNLVGTNYEITPIPLPSAIILLGGGLVSIFAIRRRA